MSARFVVDSNRGVVRVADAVRASTDRAAAVVSIDQPLPESFPPRFGDEEGLDRWMRACRAAAETASSRFTVAPMCILHSRRGVLRAGEAVHASDVDGLHRCFALVRRGVVVERSDLDDGPPPLEAA